MNYLSNYAGYFDESLFNEEDSMLYPELINSSIEMMNSHLMSLEQILYWSSSLFSNDGNLLKDMVPSPYSFEWSNVPSINSDSNIFDSSYLNKYGSKSSEEISSHENEQHIEQAQPQSNACQQSNNGAQADEPEVDLKIKAKPVSMLNKSGTIRKRIGRKHVETGMSKRRDVVLKSLLRKIRKCIRRNFFQNFRWLKNMHYKSIEILKRHLKSYINKYTVFDVV